MENLKKQQEKLLVLEITRKVMEYMMGLNEENETKIKKRIRKASRKVVKLYSDAIDGQHGNAKKMKKGKKIKTVQLTEQVEITNDEIIVTSVPEEYTEALAS